MVSLFGTASESSRLAISRLAHLALAIPIHETVWSLQGLEETDMSSFQALTLAYAFFMVALFLFFWLFWKANQVMTELTCDTIPGVSLRGRRARWVRLYAIYVPHVLGYILVGFGAGFAELQVGELAQDANTTILANFFAFFMLSAGTGALLMNIPGFSGVVKMIRKDEQRAHHDGHRH